MEHSPSTEADRFSASLEIPRILWYPNVHYRIHERPPPVPILSQINIVCATQPTFLRSILKSSYHIRLGLQVLSSPQVSPPKSCMHLFFSPHFYMPRPSHSSRFHHPNNIAQNTTTGYK